MFPTNKSVLWIFLPNFPASQSSKEKRRLYSTVYCLSELNNSIQHFHGVVLVLVYFEMRICVLTLQCSQSSPTAGSSVYLHRWNWQLLLWQFWQSQLRLTRITWEKIHKSCDAFVISADTLISVYYASCIIKLIKMLAAVRLLPQLYTRFSLISAFNIY